MNESDTERRNRLIGRAVTSVALAIMVGTGLVWASVIRTQKASPARPDKSTGIQPQHQNGRTQLERDAARAEKGDTPGTAKSGEAVKTPGPAEKDLQKAGEKVDVVRKAAPNKPQSKMDKAVKKETKEEPVKDTLLLDTPQKKARWEALPSDQQWNLLKVAQAIGGGRDTTITHDGLLDAVFANLDFFPYSKLEEWLAKQADKVYRTELLVANLQTPPDLVKRVKVYFLCLKPEDRIQVFSIAQEIRRVGIGKLNDTDKRTIQNRSFRPIFFPED